MPSANRGSAQSDRRSARPDATTTRILVIEPGRAERHYWRDLWHYRELFAILAWRDVAVRYKQTVIGVAWAVVRPFLTMVVFTIVFGKLAGLPSDGTVPYPVMVFAGMLPWFLFAGVLGEASNSLVGNANLIGKVYFPRLIIPTAAAVVALVDFAINLAILVGLMAWYGFVPGWQIVLLPAFVALAVLASLGPALLITALNVKYRDFRYIIPFIVQFGLYVSPGRLLERRGAGGMAPLVQPQPDGRRHRRLPLVPPGRREPPLPAGLRAEPRRRRGIPLARHRLLPPHRADLRGSDVMNTS